MKACEMIFEPFPKIPRLENEEMVITEKIDGTNAQILISDDGAIKFGSRTRWLSLEADNYGFCRWGSENIAKLLLLKPGRYYGEWWGRGIQRGYDLNERRFSFFHYPEEFPDEVKELVHRIPEIHKGTFNRGDVEACVNQLKELGSPATGYKYKNPEGIMIWLSKSKQYYKVPFNK